MVFGIFKKNKCNNCGKDLKTVKKVLKVGAYRFCSKKCENQLKKKKKSKGKKDACEFC